MSLTRERAIQLRLDACRAEGQAASTLRLTERVLRRQLPRLARPVARVRRKDVVRWLAERAEEVSSATRSRELSTLRGLFRQLEDEGHMSEDPTRGLRVKVNHRAPLLLSGEQVQALLREAERTARSEARRRSLGLRNRATLELLYGLGLRASEACRVLVRDLDLVAGLVSVERSKRGKPAVLPLPPASTPSLEAYLAEGRPELVGRGDQSGGRVLVTERGRELSVTAVERILCKAAERAGISAHPHALRRSVATHLVQSGAGLLAVQHLLGHESLDTTQRYVAHGLEQLREAVDRLGPA